MSSRDLEGRTVMVTGASRGLGAALALAFAESGARVSVCAREASALKATEEAIGRLGVPCVASAADVSDPLQVEAWVEETVRRLGAPSVLVNNASLLGSRVPLAEYPLEDWWSVLEVNLTGPFVVTREVLPHLRAAGGGSIVNVTSGAALLPRVNWGAYSVSKHALEGWSLNLAMELEGTGIRVNLVDPGSMRTGMRAAAYPEEDPASVKAPGSAAGVFLWLASDRAAGVTGRRFRADEWEAGGGAGG